MMMNSSFLSSASFNGHPSTNTVVVGSSAPTIHAQYRCDVCKVQPIQGIRYHCDSCTDYDMCQNCWKHRRNEHPSFHNFSTFGTAGSGSFLTNNNISSFSSNVPSSSFNTINMMNSSSSVPSSLPSNMNTSTTYTPPYQPPIPTNIPNNPSVQPLSQRVFYNQLPPSTNSQPTTFSPPKPLLNPTVTSSSPSNVKLPSGNVIPFQPSTTSGSSVNNSSSTLAHNTTHIHINHTHTCQCCNKKIPTSIFQCETCFELTPSEDYCLCKECHDSFEEFNKSGADINPIHLGDHSFKEFLDHKQLKIWKKTKEELGNQKAGSKQFSELQNLDIDEDRLLCVVCSEQLRNIVFLECKHCVCCDGCVDSLKKTCPICRSSSDHIKIFWA